MIVKVSLWKLSRERGDIWKCIFSFCNYVYNQVLKSEVWSLNLPGNFSVISNFLSANYTICYGTVFLLLIPQAIPYSILVQLIDIWLKDVGHFFPAVISPMLSSRLQSRLSLDSPKTWMRYIYFNQLNFIFCHCPLVTHGGAFKVLPEFSGQLFLW